MSNDNPFQSPQSDLEESSSGYVTQVDGRLNPWLSVWFRPRATIRYVIQTDPTNQIWVLACVGGIATSLPGSISLNNPTPGAELDALFGLCIRGAFTGGFAIWILPVVIRWTSSWFGGVANVAEVRAALAWGFVPPIWVLVQWLPLLGMYGPVIFTARFKPIEMDHRHYFLLLGGITLINLIMLAWHFVIHCKMVGEVNEIAAWRAAVASILAGMIIWLPIALIGLAIELFTPDLYFFPE